MSFLTLVWLVWLSFVVHELEEWKITEFERRNFEGFPATATARSAHGWIAFICTVGLVWCAAATFPGNLTFAAYLFLPALVLMLLNALQHVYWSLLFRQYAPGVITAVVLLIPLTVYLIMQAALRAYVSRWYIAMLMAGLVFGFVHTAVTGKHTSPAIHAIYRIGSGVAEKFTQ